MAKEFLKKAAVKMQSRHALLGGVGLRVAKSVPMSKSEDMIRNRARRPIGEVWMSATIVDSSFIGTGWQRKRGPEYRSHDFATRSMASESSLESHQKEGKPIEGSQTVNKHGEADGTPKLDAPR